jgi:hypothetical protein
MQRAAPPGAQLRALRMQRVPHPLLQLHLLRVGASVAKHGGCAHQLCQAAQLPVWAAPPHQQVGAQLAQAGAQVGDAVVQEGRPAFGGEGGSRESLRLSDLAPVS